MFACAVTKPAIERPTALGALRHRAPARNVSLILIPWWTWSFTSSLLHLVTWWVLWDWRGLRTGRSTGASWWLDHQGCGHVHTRSGRIFLPGWQRIHPVVSQVAGDQRVSYGWHCLQALWQVFQIWGWRRRSFTMDDRAPPFSFPTHLGACNVLSFLGSTNASGRPVLEQLGAVVDFGTGKMKILGGQWTNIERGKQDVMLLKLADNVHNISDFQDPRFDLRAKDDDHSRAEHLRDFLADLRAEGRYDEMQPEAQFTEDPDDEVFLWSWNYINVEDDASDEIFNKDEVVERDHVRWPRHSLDAEPAGCNQSSHSSSTQEEAHLGASSCKWPMNLNLMRFTSPRCTL